MGVYGWMQVRRGNGDGEKIGSCRDVVVGVDIRSGVGGVLVVIRGMKKQNRTG